MFCITLITEHTASILVYYVMFRRLFGKPDIYHLPCCSLSNNEVMKILMNEQGQMNLNTQQSDNIVLLLYWDLNPELSFACSIESLYKNMQGCYFK
jgi:hypothetical protein